MTGVVDKIFLHDEISELLINLGFVMLLQRRQVKVGRGSGDLVCLLTVMANVPQSGEEKKVGHLIQEESCILLAGSPLFPSSAGLSFVEAYVHSVFRLCSRIS